MTNKLLMHRKQDATLHEYYELDWCSCIGVCSIVMLWTWYWSRVVRNNFPNNIGVSVFEHMDIHLPHGMSLSVFMNIYRMDDRSLVHAMWHAMHLLELNFIMISFTYFDYYYNLTIKKSHFISFPSNCRWVAYTRYEAKDSRNMSLSRSSTYTNVVHMYIASNQKNPFTRSRIN